MSVSRPKISPDFNLPPSVLFVFNLANPRDPFSTLEMKRLALLCYLTVLLCPFVKAQPQAEDTWDLVRVFNASTHVFYGEVLRVVPEPAFNSGVLGVHVQDLGRDELPTQELRWAEGKHVTFTVTQSFKGQMGDSFECYRSDQDLNLWTYVENDAGDVFLSPPVALEPLLLKLSQTDRGLFFVRYYLGSNIPVLYGARFGQRAEDDLELLRAHQTAGGVSLERVLQQRQMQQELQTQQDAAAFKVFEDEYYKMLRIRELELRRSLLEDLVARMGYEGRWSYYGFKARYLKRYGAYIEEGEPQAVPSEPIDDKGKLWKAVSEELDKIDLILKARASKR